MNAKRILLIFLLGHSASTSALTLSQSPLFIATTEPRVMLLTSRDHQLSIKAYTDYTDIDGGGLDITYKDNFNYYGYFDFNKCYIYSATNNRFEPSGPVTTGTHQCSTTTTFSGNFMNWATMTRMDVLRKTFYGGYRSTDSTTETVLERHFLPNDVHAFAKVYNPGSATDLKQYLPDTVVGTNTAISLCNVSDSTNTNLTGLSSFTRPNPLIKIAAGTWPQWDESEVNECEVNTGQSTQPTSLIGSAYIARIKACDSSAGVEDNCKTYTHPTTGAKTIKPTGLLQKYGDVDAERRVRFGLMTGSYAANKSGGVLRKNVSLLANNNNISVTSASVCGNNNGNDEIDACTGLFINQGATQAGIINTLNRLLIAGFKYTSSGGNGSYQYSCNSPGILSFTDGQCVDWGNPLSEMYLESLRYFANQVPTTAFNVSDASILNSIPPVTWADPLPAAEWCALCNIIVMSTGSNSFDTDQLAAFSTTTPAIDASTLTQTVGDSSHENINGKSFLIGDNGTTSDNQCTAKTITNLATAKGVCPEVPSLQGGYGIAGLAYAPKTIDLRPEYASKRNTRWGGITTDAVNPDWALRQPINTYTVQLGESLPSFSVPVGLSTITVLPACQANSNGTAPAWTSSASGWRNCAVTNLTVDTNVATTDVDSDSTAKTNTCSGNTSTSRCFTVSWDDSTWGNDHDMDVIQRMGYCVGDACKTFKMLCPSTSKAADAVGPWTDVSSTQIRVATCAIQASAGHELTFGYTVTGTNPSGSFFPILRPGNLNFSVGQTLPSGITGASFSTFDVSLVTAPAGVLNDPLWYAAKYGGFTDSTPTVGTPSPDLASEWDAVNNLTGANGSDGQPDNYFNVRNPSILSTALGNVFDRASQKTGDAASAATNSTNLKLESRIYQAKFSSVDWSGQLLSFLFSNGVLSTTPEWDAGQKINAQTSRVILTYGATDGVAFAYSNLPSTKQALLDKNAAGVIDNCGTDRVAYLRGSAANEGTATATFACSSPSTSTITKFRQRNTSKLGDIVNSNPLFVGQPSAGFADADQPGYSAFRKANASRKPIVYAGSNDGMLHGIDASLDFSTNAVGVPTSTAGQEVLAYIPSVVFPNLSKLTDQAYNKNHLYFVDGSPMAGDADVSPTSPTAVDWRTVLVTSLGAGGKGYVALDVTNPANFSETSTAAANTLLWEFNDTNPVAETDIGFAYNLPPTNTTTSQAKQIVKLANGKWAVIVGNGYNSVAGKAVLYIIFIANGVDGKFVVGDYVKIVADAPTGQDNGLSTPVPYDSNGDGFADTVYAGDLKGNMWKFLIGPNCSDLTSTSTTSIPATANCNTISPAPNVSATTSDTATWRVALSPATCTATPSTCVPLFKAKDSSGTAQPIISPPEVTTHPNGGQIVLFGTGKYIETSDISSTAGQTFYGIWARNDNVSTVGTRAADLLQQTLSDTACASPAVAPCTFTATGGASFRIATAKAINWRPATGTNAAANCTPVATCNPTHMGWYIDLPTAKERATGIPKFINKTIFFNSLIPSDAPCDAGGTGWLMALDYQSGGLVSRTIFDTNNSGTINTSDIKVAAYQVGASIGGTTLIQNKTNSGKTNIGVGVTARTTGNLGTTLVDFGLGARGRMNWREINP